MSKNIFAWFDSDLLSVLVFVVLQIYLTIAVILDFVE